MRYLLIILMIFNVSCISFQTNSINSSSYLEFSPIRSSLRSQDLKHSELVVSVNLFSQPKYGGGRRSLAEIRGTLKASRPSDSQIPIPNGFEIGPKIRW